MGLITATVTKHYLIAYRNELEAKIDTIQQSKLELSRSATELMSIGNDLDPDNPMVKQLETRKQRLNDLEKKLDLELTEYKTKLEMVDKNLEAADKMEESAIKRI